MKSSTLLSILLFLPILTFSQELLFDWGAAFGNNVLDRPECMKVDALGNVYLAGHFAGTMDFDPGEGTTELTAAGGRDAYFMKLNPSGEFLWAKAIGGISEDRALALDVSLTGEVVVTGHFTFSADFDPGEETYELFAEGNIDIFVAKYNSDGQFLWANAMGGPANDQGQSICVDQSGNVTVTGEFRNTVDFDPTKAELIAESEGNSDVFVIQYNEDGNLNWFRQMGGSGPDSGRSIDVNSSGDLVITGDYQSTAVFDFSDNDPSLTAVEFEDGFVTKLSNTGDVLWARSVGGEGLEQPYAVELVESGNIYCSGLFSGTTDFDPGEGVEELTSNGASDFFVFKLDSDGNHEWAKSAGSSGGEASRSLALDQDERVFISGFYNNTVDFDPSGETFEIQSQGLSDVFIQVLDEDGEFLTAISMGGSAGSLSQGVDTEDLGNVYCSGWFDTTIDLDPGENEELFDAVGQFDGFVVKLNFGITRVGEVNSALEILTFPNPAAGELQIEGVEVEDLILLLDVSGKFVQTLHPGKNAISHLPSGIYFLRVESSQSIRTQKLIIRN